MKPAKYTPEQEEWLKAFIPGHSHKEIAEEFAKRFWDITTGQVKSYIKNRKLSTGRTGHFEKGNIPHNKGQKMSKEQYEKCKSTMFKKGQKAHNYRPIGSERINKDGYIEIKVSDAPGDWRRKWRLKHQWVWEQYNGPRPKDAIVTFIDNNPLNCDISNLTLINKKQHLAMNRYKLYGHTGEAKEVAINIAKCIVTINERKGEIK